MKIDKAQILSSFWFKLLALLTMTIDHAAIFLMMYLKIDTASSLYPLYLAMRCIGRLSFPLFIFLLIEGIYHTKNIWNYILRLSIVMVGVLAVSIALYYAYSSQNFQLDNAFIDLVVIALFFACLKQKGYQKLLALIPLSYTLLCTIVPIIESQSDIAILWLPEYIRMPYALYGLALALFFYFAHPLAQRLSKDYVTALNTDMETFKKIPYYRSLVNSICALGLIIVNVVFWVASYINNSFAYFGDMGIQSWSILAGLILILYNGRRGYDKGWFKYGAYMYYPLHLIILFVIFQLVFIGQLF